MINGIYLINFSLGRSIFTFQHNEQANLYSLKNYLSSCGIAEHEYNKIIRISSLIVIISTIKKISSLGLGVETVFCPFVPPTIGF
jgi:hypothetical protein